MKRLKFTTKFNTTSSNLWINARSTLSYFVKLEFGGLNHLHDNLNLSSLYDYVRQCEFADMHEKITSALPFVNLFFAIGSQLISGVRVFFASKCIDKPIDETFIGATYDQIGGVLRSASVSCFVGSTSQCSLTIYNACHISRNSIRVGFSNIFESHIHPLIKVSRYVYHNIIKGQSQRLSERAFLQLCKKEAIV